MKRINVTEETYEKVAEMSVELRMSSRELIALAVESFMNSGDYSDLIFTSASSHEADESELRKQIESSWETMPGSE